MPWGFYHNSNLIFGIIARMFCRDHRNFKVILDNRPLFFSSELFYLTILVHEALAGKYTPLASQ